MAKLDFTTFVLSVSSAVYMGLGKGSQAGELNLELARQNIDLLNLLLEKTKGNLSPEEERLLSQLLFECRMSFVEASKT